MSGVELTWESFLLLEEHAIDQLYLISVFFDENIYFLTLYQNVFFSYSKELFCGVYNMQLRWEWKEGRSFAAAK